jgi:hypothetical protein
MRIVIESSATAQQWTDSVIPSQLSPRLPLLYSSLRAFTNAGHTVSLITGSSSISNENNPGFERIYGPSETPTALAENDFSLLWASLGIQAAAKQFLSGSRRNIYLASYVWCVPNRSRWSVWCLALTTRVVARRAAGLVLMTHEQAKQARQYLPKGIEVIEFTWGIDSEFYRHESNFDDIATEHRDLVAKIIQAPYVILAGDQLRHDDDAFTLVKEHGFRLVRVPQERHTAERYRQEAARSNLADSLFVIEKATYATLRYLMQNASAYVGLVDSSWQPAGWTVLCEAIASGTPAVVYEGLVTREMSHLGGSRHFAAARHRDVSQVACILRSIQTSARDSNNKREKFEFSKSILDINVTAARFVSDVEKAECSRSYNMRL